MIWQLRTYELHLPTLCSTPRPGCTHQSDAPPAPSCASARATITSVDLCVLGRPGQEEPGSGAKPAQGVLGALWIGTAPAKDPCVTDLRVTALAVHGAAAAQGRADAAADAVGSCAGGAQGSAAQADGGAELCERAVSFVLQWRDDGARPPIVAAPRCALLCPACVCLSEPRQGADESLARSCGLFEARLLAGGGARRFAVWARGSGEAQQLSCDSESAGENDRSSDALGRGTEWQLLGVICSTVFHAARVPYAAGAVRMCAKVQAMGESSLWQAFDSSATLTIQLQPELEDEHN